MPAADKNNQKISVNLFRKSTHGHQFQNRYKSILCEEDLYLLELVRYIHLNPLRAGIVEGLKKLDTYPYCGHFALMGKVEQGFQDVDYVLNLAISKKMNIAPSTAIECVTRSRKIVDEKGLKLLGKGIESE